MRRLLTTVATAALMVGLVAAPAVAHTEEFRDSVSFEDVNPCSGETITINIDMHIQLMDEDGVFIVRASRTGYTSDGYYMYNGRESFHEEEGLIAGAFNDPWVNPELGTKFTAQGRVLIIGEDVVFDDFRLVCNS